MTENENIGIPQIRIGPIKWLGDTIRKSIEEAVSRHKNRKWKIKSEKDYSEFAYNRAAIVSDDSYSVFFKYGKFANSGQQFKTELSDLKYLKNKAGVLIPNPIDIVQTENGWLLIMKALDEIKPQPEHWFDMGKTLAKIHLVDGEYNGFERDGYWGPLIYENQPSQNWADFFRERRMIPMLKSAVDSGNMPSSLISKIEKIITCFPELCGEEVTPVLLHGDAQKNNFVCTANGTYVIDPTIFYGHPEYDLALIDSWEPVPDDFFDGYKTLLPIKPGFHKRRDLWRIPLYLSAVALEGKMHLERLISAVDKVLIRPDN